MTDGQQQQQQQPDQPLKPGDVDGPPRTARRPLAVPADMTMYAALAGRPPAIDPTLRDPVVAATVAVRADPFNPSLVTAYVRAVVIAKAKANRPVVAAWVRRQSDVARRRLGQLRRKNAECKMQSAK